MKATDPLEVGQRVNVERGGPGEVKSVTRAFGDPAVLYAEVWFDDGGIDEIVRPEKIEKVSE